MKPAKDFIIKHWNPEVIPGECDVKHFFDEMDRVMQLYSDHQNKELREENERLILGIRRGQHLAENLKWSDDPNAEGFTANEKEIQRLTKEVEELRGKVEKWVFSGVALHAKNTRLLELLGKAETLWDDLAEAGELKIGPKFSEKYDQLKKEINDTRNPKP